MRIVIVGGAGFIGSALAQSLHARGLQPLVLDTAPRLAKARASLGSIATAAFDFSASPPDARRLFAGADALVHLGCTTNPAHSMQGIAWDAESNIAPSVRLFDAAAEAGIRRVVFASSGGTVYGMPQRMPVSEADPARPLSAYGVSKLAIENYLALYTQLLGISLRVANPYGSFQLSGTQVGVIARCVAAVHKNEAIEVWGDGCVVRDYIAIEDVIEAFRLAIETPAMAPGAYNIGTGIGSSVNDIIDTVFAIAGRDVPVSYLQGRPYDVPAIVLDSSRFQACTPWTASVALRAGIANLWACCKE
jgi:UDP-glucose 4-epimerase